ncbi:hypothetical protein [Priestia koreensis]|uniref:hypothetical protein n=1 Tax=Priestia koreensis TaxID=284581 RepID=UPI00203D24C3|nr:hypothetical protein [Priestia koreensis]MCM3006835.1 hypothetical protein [Priestia koreensis]
MNGRTINIVNICNTLVAMLLLILLNVQLLTNLPIFGFRYLFISVLGIIICLFGMRNSVSFFTIVSGSLHIILIISFLGMVIFGLGINYQP